MKRFSTFLLRSLCAFLIVHGLSVSASGKQLNFYFDEGDSSLEGSINYSIIGTYRASFEEFEGVLHFNERRIERSSVELKIKTASIHSKYPTLDRIVRSSRLLDAQNYPYITFKSDSIKRVPDGYQVEGMVQLHDVTQRLSFIFQFDGPISEGNELYIVASGRWRINRKDFDIIWNEWLDHGGVIVGNYITVDWAIKAFK